MGTSRPCRPPRRRRQANRTIELTCYSPGRLVIAVIDTALSVRRLGNLEPVAPRPHACAFRGSPSPNYCADLSSGATATDPDRYLVIALFDDYDSAMVNSNLPEPQAFGEKLVRTPRRAPDLH